MRAGTANAALPSSVFSLIRNSEDVTTSSRKHRSLGGKTPAMAARITDHMFTVRDMLFAADVTLSRRSPMGVLPELLIHASKR